MARFFHLEEAENLLRELEALLREAVEANRRFAQAQSELEETGSRIAMLGGVQVDRRQLLARQGRRDALASRVRELIEAIQQYGCLVKDLGVGLIDFPTWYQGRQVLMCWRLGESAIEFWHEVEEGYRGRKPIDRDFRAGHRGEQGN